MATTTIKSSSAQGVEPNRRVHSAGAIASMVVSATPGTLCFGFVRSQASSARFLQVHDAAALPADGAVPIISVDLDTLANKGRVTIDSPIPMATGCVLAISSTDLTLTASADTAQMVATFKA